MNRNAYTPITADPVLLRLNSCRDWGTLHQRIRKAFPDCAFQVSGAPKDVDSARYLAESSGLEGKTGMPCGIA